MAAIFGDIVWKLGVWEEVWMCLVSGRLCVVQGDGFGGCLESRFEVDLWVGTISIFWLGISTPNLVRAQTQVGLGLSARAFLC